MKQGHMAFARSLSIIFHYLVMLTRAQHIYQPQSEWVQNDCEKLYQIIKEFRKDISELKHSVRQLQNKELGLVEMRPTVLYARLDNTSELMCSIHYKGHEWSAVNIFQQNASGSFSLLNISRGGKVESKNARINASMTVSGDFINVTLSFDLSRGAGVCELNQTYFCNIELIDTAIGTKAAHSTMILDTPPSNLTVETMAGMYIGESYETINCTANMNPECP